jgi:hypothetical protein
MVRQLADKSRMCVFRSNSFYVGADFEEYFGMDMKDFFTLPKDRK